MVPPAQETPTRQRVARNAGIYLIVQLVSWCVTFVTLSVVPRRLGEHHSGELVLASTTVQTVFSVGAMCIDDYLVRETGRDATRALPLIRATLGLRLCLFPALMAIAWFALRAVGANPTVMALGMLTIPAVFIASLGNPLRSALAGREQAREVSLSDLWLSSSPLLAIPFLNLYGAAPLVWTRILTQASGVVFKLRWLRHSGPLRPLFAPRIWLELIRGSVPFLLNSYVGIFNNYVAVLVLHHFLNESAVGEFSQANRLMGTFLVVPTVLSAALLPVLTRMADMDAAAFAQARLRVVTTVIVSCLPVMVGMALLAEPLCHVLYQDRYVHVPRTLQIGALQLLPLYIIITSLQFLVAQGRNALWSAVLAGTLCLNAGLSWLLIPRMAALPGGGVAGAMLADTLAEYFAMVAAFILMKVNPLAPSMLNRLARGVVAAAAMAAAVQGSRLGLASLPLPFLASNILQLVVPALLGSVVFIGLAGVLRAFPPEEQALVVGLIRKRLRRRSAPAPAPPLVIATYEETMHQQNADLEAQIQALRAENEALRRGVLRYADACASVDAQTLQHAGDADDIFARTAIRDAIREEEDASHELRRLAQHLREGGE